MPEATHDHPRSPRIVEAIRHTILKKTSSLSKLVLRFERPRPPITSSIDHVVRVDARKRVRRPMMSVATAPMTVMMMATNDRMTVNRNGSAKPVCWAK